MGHIEESGVPSSAEVFFDCAGWVLDRHVPTAEINHAPANAAMHSIKRRSFELWGDCTHARVFRLIHEPGLRIKVIVNG